jgi:hypothetical protein
MIAKVFGEWGADRVGFGDLLRPHFPNYDAWLQYGWPDRVRELEVQVEMYIRRFGLLLDVQR